jgi:pimeloyl-ACP methyl ester carboxylesterase
VVNEQLRGIFTPLSRPSPTLDYLYDMTGHVTDSKYWTNFSSDTSNSENWYRLYWEQFYMAYDTTSLQSDETIYESIMDFGPDTVPFGILDVSYYKLVDNALTTNLYFDFDTLNDLLADKINRANEPYIRSNIFTAAPLYHVAKYGKITWVITPEFIFKDGDNSPFYNPSSYQLTIDFGDGNGPQLFDQTVTTYHTVDYANLGMHGEAYIEAVISQDAQPIKKSKSSFMLGKTGTLPRQPDERLLYGLLPVSVFRSCNSTAENRKIVIYLEGFDMLDFLPKQNRTAADIFNDMLKVPNISQLMNFGYDFYVVDWPNSRQDMRINAEKIVALIDELKGEAENNNEFVIIGESMGGVIARYVLTYMESQNYLDPVIWPAANRRERMHNCRLMITWDSPHQGANIPLGIQQLYKTVTGSNTFFGIPNLKKLVLRYSNKYLDAMAARQLLIYHIDTKSFAGLYKTYSAHNERNDFLSDLSALGNYPQYCKKMAVSNGALNGEMQTQFYNFSDRVANDRLLDFEALLYARVLGIKVGILGADLEVNTNPDGQGKIFQVNAGTWWIRVKFYWFGVRLFTGYNSLLNSIDYADVIPYCVNPGGFFGKGYEQVVGQSTASNTHWDLSKTWLFNIASFHSGSDGSGCWGTKAHVGFDGFASANFDLSICSDGMHFCFIPLQSALDINANGLGLSTLHDDIEGTYNASTIMANTPFDVIVSNGAGDASFMGSHNLNRNHLYVKYEDYQSKLEELFSYRDCNPNNEIFGHWVNREIGDETFHLDNLICTRSSIYEAQYELFVNTFDNPWYKYTTGGTGRPGFYSKANDFIIKDNVNADFRYDVSTHNPPTVENYIFIPSLLQGSSPYDGTWLDNTNSAGLACGSCVDFGKRRIDRNSAQDRNLRDIGFAKVYPNPNSSGQVFVTYKFNQESSALITISDMLGNILYTKSLPNGKPQQQISTAINLSEYGLSKGLYFVTLSCGNERFINKLIIE